MQGFSLGAGLAAFAFWIFIASIVVAGIWYDIRKRDAQHETARWLIDSGQPVDKAVLDRLLATGTSSDRLDRTFKVTAWIMLPIAIGLAMFGFILGVQVPEAKYPLLGAAVLTACIGIGFLVAAGFARRWYQ
jgi:hypothetical protein